jgi:putative component of membrane protein insertase Oxa1/YidC/SpoIIIJ protein YidD
MLRSTIAAMISVYQQHISFRKNYCCAHRALYGGWSCSEYGKRAVLRHGVIRFVLLQGRRFSNCAKAQSILKMQEKKGEKEYSDFPWKACVSSKEMQSFVGGCCCWPWGR